jgi:hypothetical protein
MSEYRKAITERIKESLNNWIETLKKEQPELLLTKQWQILFPKGFNEGYNILSVVTGSKKGQHLIAQVEFVLPRDLELDYGDLELVLKNEPYKEPTEKVKRKAVPVPIDEPIDVLNNMITGVNSFLSSLNINAPSTATFSGFNQLTQTQQPPVKVAPLLSTTTQKPMEAAPPFKPADENLVENVKNTMLKSEYLPEWLKTIENREVFEALMQKLSEGFIHYQKKIGHAVDLKEYFDLYESHLKEQGKLHYYCKYKGKPVKHDSNEYCLESYCSKMPYKSKCSYSTLKFGTTNN